jgi:hypothetical protein
LRKVILAALALSLLAGMAAAQADLFEGTWSRNVTFSFEQSVDGDGYFMTYRYIQLKTPDDPDVDGDENILGPMLKDYAHGSGTIDSEVIINAEDVDFTNQTSDGYIEVNRYSCISMREDTAMVYSPMSMAYGNGYYAEHPINYESLLKEKTCIKNYRAATSMHHQIEYAKAIDKELNVLVKDKNYTYTDPVYEGVGYTSMSIIEDVTDGKTHIGVLQGEPNSMSNTGYNIPPTTAWKDPLIEIDEDYVGTYHIEKNMTLEVPYKDVLVTEDWLTCCFGGCEDMDSLDRKYVDCACPDYPWN